MKKSAIRFIALVLTISLCMMPTNTLAAGINHTQNWDNGKPGYALFTNGSGGNYSVTWSSNSGSDFNMIVGKGWKPGNASQVIGYNAGIFKQTSATGCSWMGVIGWTINPLVEFFIIDSWTNYRPAEGTRLGTINSDGGTYDVYSHQKIGQPSISGTQTFLRVSGVRQTQRMQGQNNIITVANHINGWKSLGITLGTQIEYIIFAVEGYESSGQANVFVW